ncbi:MAG: hypothetical protein PVF13_08520 [Chromatiales bacterium]|jgi:hypothetical protein
MRLSDRFLLLCLALSTLFVSSLIEVSMAEADDNSRLARRQMLIARLGLTDPALFTEASYTRHLSLSDRHVPFQNHPMAFEHFPSGSLIAPPDLGRP